MKEDECKDKCATVGSSFGRQVWEDPVLFPINVRGMVKEEDLTVPHSELAMVVGAAGKRLIAWSVNRAGTYAHILYDDGEGCCAMAHGLPTEVMQLPLLEQHGELMGPEALKRITKGT